MASKIRLSKQEIAKLKPHLDAWPTLTKERRNSEKEAFITEFLEGRDEDSKDEYRRYTMWGKITQWFSNHAEHTQNRLPGSLKTHWTARQVFNERMAEKIARKQDKILRKATEEGTRMRDIVALNKARMYIWKKLSDSKRAEFAEEAEQWTAEGPDPLSKLEVIEKRVPGWVDSFSSLLFDQAGVMAHLTLCHLDADGQVVETTFDISDSWHRQEKKTLQYTKVYPNWQHDFPGSFVRFSRGVLCPDEDFDDEGAVILKVRVMYDPIVLDVYPEGDPILPPLSSMPLPNLPRQAVLRQFLNAHYALACGVAGVPVPYNTLSTNNAKFLCPHSVKEGDIILDLSRMASGLLVPVWEHIVKLQKLDDPEQRFRFAKWYDSDTKHYLDAKYDGLPAAKKANAAKKKSRSGGPPASNPWHADRINAVALPRSGNSVPGRTQGPAAKLPTQPRPGTSKKPRHTSKGKAKATEADDSDSAISSDTDEQPSDPPLESDGSVDEFDFDALGGLHGGDDEEDEASPVPGPSGTRHDSGTPPPQDVHATSPVPAAKSSRDLWAIENAAAIPMKPNGRLVQQASNQPPAWVEHVKERVFAFLWALAGEGVYRELLTAWRHMLDRRASFKSFPIGHWANWDYTSVALPNVIHQDVDTWAKFLQWIFDAAPKANSSASDVQSWLLVVGMALRDTHACNEVEEDMPVRPPWPEYIRHSPADLKRDIITRLEPMLANVYRPLADDALAPPFHHLPAGIAAKPHLPPGTKIKKPLHAVRSAKSRDQAVHVPATSSALRVETQQGLAVAGQDNGETKAADANDHDLHPQPVSDVSKGATDPRRTRPRRRGPPGVPAASFPISHSQPVRGSKADGGSIAEVEQAIDISTASKRPISAGSTEPQSISAGLAKAWCLSGVGRNTPVPIVLIQSTIADRLKRRRRGIEEPSSPEAVQEPGPAAGQEGDAVDVRRSSRAPKRKRMH